MRNLFDMLSPERKEAVLRAMKEKESDELGKKYEGKSIVQLLRPGCSLSDFAEDLDSGASSTAKDTTG